MLTEVDAVSSKTAVPSQTATELLGREPELQALQAALQALPRATSLAAIAVLGEPGIGKSRLLAEALDGGGQGALVLRGCAAEFERQLPFGILVEAFDGCLDAIAPRVLGSLGSAQRTQLASVFPAFAAVADGGFAESGPSRGPSHLHRAVSELLRALAGQRPVVLVLDDLQWADQASLEMLVRLLNGPLAAPVLVLVAMRSAQAPEWFRHALAAACANGRCARVELGPLSREDAERLLRTVERADRREAIYREAGGNPLYIKQLIRGDGAGDAWPGDGELADVPREVGRALVAELAELSSGARLAVDAASVAGEPFSCDLVAAVADADRAVVFEGLDEALDRGLLVSAETPGRFAFRHPIVRRAVYASCRPAWRVGAHERAAAALAARGARASSRAHHVECSAREGDETAIALLLEAGRETARLAPASAARWFEAALRLLPERTPIDRRIAVLIPLATALSASGQLARAGEVLGEVLDLLVDRSAALRVRALVAMAVIERLLGHGGRARGALGPTLLELDGERSLESATLELELAADRYFDGDWQEMAAHAHVALASARHLRDDSLTAAAAAVLGLGELNQGDTASARRHMLEGACLLDALSDRQVRVHLGAVHWVGWCEHHLERYADVLRHYERGLALGHGSGQRHLLVPMLAGSVITRTWRGELRLASQEVDEALETAHMIGSEQLIALTAALRCWLAVRVGALPEVLAASAGPIATLAREPAAPQAVLARAWLGEAQSESGSSEVGRQAIVVAAGGAELPRMEPSQRAYFHEVLTRAALRAGEDKEAERWARLALSSAERVRLGGPRMWAARARAEVALARGNSATAVRCARASVVAAAGVHALERERSRLVLGRALAAAGEKRAAVEAFEQARARLSTFGAHGLEPFAARELRALGRHVPRAGRRARGTEGIPSLSGRELEVARLVSDHLTNREIAERLVLSSKTVERHMTNILRKLRMSSRGEVARAVAAETARVAAAEAAGAAQPPATSRRRNTR